MRKIKKLAFIGILVTISIGFLPAAHAEQTGFRKALDAYIARDGDAMLAAVKEAVEAKDSDGLMLFLMATNLDAETSEFDAKTRKTSSTLRDILPEQQWGKMHALLKCSVNNASVDARYYLYIKSQFSPFYRQRIHVSPMREAYEKELAKYAEMGSYEAVQMMDFTADHPRKGEHQKSFLKRSKHWLIKYASLGDARSQLKLGLQYHNYVGDFGCDLNENGSICKAGKNKKEGDFWLKKAIKSFQVSGHDHFQLMVDIMCDFTNTIVENKTKPLQQESERWCSIPYSLNKQTIDFGSRHIPRLLKESWAELMADNPPIISVNFSVIKPVYNLDIYSDGSVLVVFNSNVPTYKEKLYTLSKPALKSFLNELDRIFKEKHLQQSSTIGTGRYGDDGLTVRMSVVDRRNNSLRQLYVEQPVTKTLNQNDVWTIQLAKLKYVVEKNIELKTLVNGLGKSQSKRDNRIRRDNEWASIAKQNLEK